MSIISKFKSIFSKNLEDAHLEMKGRVEETAAEVSDVFKVFQDFIDERIDSARLSGSLVNENVLNAERSIVNEAIVEMLDTTMPIVKETIIDAYDNAVGASIEELGKAAVKVDISYSSGVHGQALGELLDQVQERFEQAAVDMALNADELLVALSRQQITGEGTLLEAMEEAGVTRGEQSYRLINAESQMNHAESFATRQLRTIGRQADSLAKATLQQQMGYDLLRVNKDSHPADSCTKWELQYLSVSGDIKTYGGKKVYPFNEETAPPYHPNCDHYTIPVPVKLGI